MKKNSLLAGLILTMVFLASRVPVFEAQGNSADQRQDGKRLFERETFEGQRQNVPHLPQPRYGNRLSGGCARPLSEKPEGSALSSRRQ